MSQFYYIDGYNVVYHCSKLRPLLDVSFETARDALIERVSRFCASTSDRVRIVFDGRGRQAEPVVPVGASGLDVIYSSSDKTADALIERAAYESRDRRNMVVVSGDRGIRDLCRGVGTMVMTPDNFLAVVDQRLDQEREHLTRFHNQYTRDTVEDRLDDATKERLKNLKKRLPPG
ncbi:MAG: hypothetical protein GY851_28695 [bacterium]|nr:hypothetical protein [bacterium]